jgi:hypothetical protein
MCVQCYLLTITLHTYFLIHKKLHIRVLKLKVTHPHDTCFSEECTSRAPPIWSTHEQTLRIMGDNHQHGWNLVTSSWNPDALNWATGYNLLKCTHAKTNYMAIWWSAATHDEQCWVGRCNLMCHGSNHFGKGPKARVHTKVAFVFGRRSVRCGLKVARGGPKVR